MLDDDYFLELEHNSTIYVVGIEKLEETTGPATTVLKTKTLRTVTPHTIMQNGDHVRMMGVVMRIIFKIF